jgi:hypothetical protein
MVFQEKTYSYKKQSTFCQVYAQIKEEDKSGQVRTAATGRFAI